MPIHVLYLDCCVDIVTVSYYISEEVSSANTDVSGDDDEHHCGPDDLWGSFTCQTSGVSGL